MPSAHRVVLHTVRHSVRREAAAEQRDADYAVMKERCSAMASDAKGRFMNEAKMRYGN